MTNKKRLVLIALMSAGILGACGTGTDTDSENQSSTAQETTTDDQADDTSSEASSSSESSSSNENQNNQQGINNQEFSILLEDAVQIFNDTNPGASIESVQFDDDDEIYEYDIDGFDDTNEYELSIDANSGETRDQESDEDDDDDNDNEALNFDSIISPQEAMDIALSEIGSGHVEEWELDMDDGRPTYEINLENTTDQNDDDDITIHAETGEVLERD